MGFVLNTDFSTIAPDEGGGRSYFPISDSKGWLCQIVSSEGKETSKKDGTILALVLSGLDGPVNGKTMDTTINVANPSQKAVEIGMAQLSAIAHVTGHVRVGNSQEWHNKPLRVVVVSDATEQYPNATKILKWLDINGNSAKDAGKGVMNAPAQAQAFQGQAQVNSALQGQANQPAANAWAGQQQGQSAGGFIQTNGNGNAPATLTTTSPSNPVQGFDPGQQFQNTQQPQQGQFQQAQPTQQFQQTQGGAGPGWNQ